MSGRLIGIQSAIIARPCSVAKEDGAHPPERILLTSLYTCPILLPEPRASIRIERGRR